MYIGLLGIILGLLVFLVLTYKGFSTYYVAAISALIIAVTNSLNPLTAITESFIGGLVEILFGLFTI
ncbi:MAG TPA: hypothetical protein DHN33_10380, partial [Eubacteriaceae bacterium]|nr:hypothetical protein [Eubacteriaceae bacterium]